MNRREIVQQAAEGWAKELTDESGRNRLLYYKELKTGTLSLDDADPRVLKRLLSGKKVQAQELFPNDRFDDAVRRIRAVNRKAVANYEEKGINTLFLGLGMATWTPVSSSATPNAPVLLCPVDLERTGAAEVDFDMRLSGDWTPNEALLQHLDNEFNVDVSGESLMDPYGDGEQISEEEEQAIFEELSRRAWAEVQVGAVLLPEQAVFAELSRRAERVPDFAITEQVVLGNFMFKKMPMVNDINNNLEALAQHDLIAAIAGDEEAGKSVRANHASTVMPSMPDRTPPQQEFLVLDADSSQNTAINAAVAGESFVLQGPPGTGKSQTISNLIATMMAKGKSVLFVAEKRAAIDAVSKRLTRVGLDGFVMDLHGGVSSRKELARQLDQSFTEVSQTPPVNQQDLHQKLQESRQELSGYAEALHSERKPWGMSYYEVLWRLMRLEASESPNGDEPQPPMWFSPSALPELDEATAQRVRRDLKDWADLSEPLRSGRSPWAGARITTYDEARSAHVACIGLTAEIISGWQAQQRVLADDLGIGDPGSIAGWDEVVAEVADLALDIAKTESTLTLDVFNRDVNRLAEDMAPAARSMFSRLFNKRYKAAKAELENLQPEASKLGAQAALDAIVAARNQARRWAELGCFGSPRVPANTEEAAEAFAKMKNTVDELALLLSEGKLAVETADGISHIAQELLNDQRTLFSLPGWTRWNSACGLLMWDR